MSKNQNNEKHECNHTCSHAHTGLDQTLNEIQFESMCFIYNK